MAEGGRREGHESGSSHSDLERVRTHEAGVWKGGEGSVFQSKSHWGLVRGEAARSASGIELPAGAMS